MTILIRNFPVHIYKDPLPTREMNLILRQWLESTRTTVYDSQHKTTPGCPFYKSHKRNVVKRPQEKCSVSFYVKSKENLLLVKIYEK